MAGRIVTIAVACGLLALAGTAVAQPQTPAQSQPSAGAQSPTQQGSQLPQPRRLTNRDATATDSDTEVTPSVVGEMQMPREASGHYDLGHGRDVMEVDFTDEGLTGYLSLFGSRATGDAKAPLTFFFMQTRVDGDRLHFVTHEIHRTWYEFDGVLAQTPPQEKTLLVDYALVGKLTTHRRDDKGVEKQETKNVRFKKMRW